MIEQEDNNPAASGMQPVSVSLAANHLRVTRKLAHELRATEHSIIPLAELPELQHIIEVQRVHPCPECGVPVALVVFEGHTIGSRVCDAVPDNGWHTWTADILTQHDCDVFPIYGTTGLQQVIAVTHGLGGFFHQGCVVQVNRASGCPGCGRLIAAVKVGQDAPQWFNAKPRFGNTNRADLYLAALSEPHQCAKTEVHQ